MSQDTGQSANIDKESKKSGNYLLPLSVLISALLIAGAWIYTTGLKSEQNQKNAGILSQTSGLGSLTDVPQAVSLSQDNFVLPVRWGNLGQKLVESGVIDKQKLEAIYQNRGGLNAELQKMLSGGENEIVINADNAGFILNLFWALGLSNKNEILENGPMTDPRYGGAGYFASTGGWTLAQGSTMDHYSRHQFLKLTPTEQDLVERVSKNIYRPCCNNSTYFPDCNHGMAMLGLLELLASQGISEGEMYRVALRVNSLWFPDNYQTIAQYLASKGYDWNKVNPEDILGQNFSSATGYQQILSQVTVPQKQGGGSCGV